MVASFVAGLFIFAAGTFLTQAQLARGFDRPSALLELILGIAGIVFGLVVHEAGHRVAGWTMHWECVRFGVGPYEFIRVDNGWKRQRVKMLWGAFVRQMPPSFKDYRRQKATTLISGPMSSLIWGLGFGTIALLAQDPLPFVVFGRLALWTWTGALELIPRYKNGIGSDGYRLWQVIRGGLPVDDLIRDSMAEASNFTPLRHRDWPHELIVRLAEGEDSYNIYLAYLHSMDSGDLDAASRYIARLIAQLPEQRPNSYYASESAYWLATHDGDPVAARKWMERTGPELLPEMRLRLEAAVALAEGDPGRAESLAKESRALLPTPAVHGSDLFGIDRLNHLLESAAVGQTVQW